MAASSRFSEVVGDSVVSDTAESGVVPNVCSSCSTQSTSASKFTA